jgi:threonylcarbamoyladenosine tRNA methylthiotransferase MtaB
VITFGCRLNLAESERIAELARGDGAGTVIVNTCAVTAAAEREARQAIRRLRRERPDARIVVTGCAAQIHPERFAAMPEVDRVVGNAEKLRAETWRANGAAPRVEVADIMTVRETAAHLVAGYADQTRAFVEVQQGCDHRCTFCIIPYGRGPSRSVPPERVAAHVRALVANGYREVVLTGVDLTAYGADLADRPTLGRLARRILDSVPDLARLRLSSLDPAEIDDAIFALLADEPRLMPHLHLSLQAGDDLILKRMKRRHTRAQALDVARRARAARPDVALGADLIAGFPTETDAMFERSAGLIGELGLAFVHVFPFSARPGTPAARMPQLPGGVVRQRAASLRERGAAATARFLAGRIGAPAQVLVERSGRAGYSEHFARVSLTGTAPPGRIVTTTIAGIAAGTLIGHLAA